MMLEIQLIKDSVNPNEIIYVADGMSGQDAVKAEQRSIRPYHLLEIF